MTTPIERAEQSGRAMWNGDAASKWLGIEQPLVEEGRAIMSMTVQPHHANGHGICHGGILFCLADSTFAFACNSRNENTVAQHCSVSFIAPVQIGDRLTATATEISVTGRNGIYDVSILNQVGTKVAEFRGFSRRIKGTLFDE